MMQSKHLLPLALFSALAVTVLSVPVDNTTYPIYRDACKREATFKLTHRNMVLALLPSEVLSIKSSKQSSLSICARECVRVSWCKAINYKANEVTENCQLLSFNASDNGAVFVPDPGWKHYEPVPSVGHPKCRANCLAKNLRCIATCEEFKCKKAAYRYKFSELSGNFSSPHYPAPYGNHLDAIWVFNAPIGYNIHVKFVDFYINYHNDLVRLLEGDLDGSEIIRFNGDSANGKSFQSEGNKMTITFTSHVEVTPRGFFAKWWMTPYNSTTTAAVTTTNVNKHQRILIQRNGGDL